MFTTIFLKVESFGTTFYKNYIIEHLKSHASINKAKYQFHFIEFQKYLFYFVKKIECAMEWKCSLCQVWFPPTVR